MTDTWDMYTRRHSRSIDIKPANIRNLPRVFTVSDATSIRHVRPELAQDFIVKAYTQLQANPNDIVELEVVFGKPLAEYPDDAVFVLVIDVPGGTQLCAVALHEEYQSNVPQYAA